MWIGAWGVGSEVQVWPSLDHSWFMFGSYLVQRWFKFLSLIRIYIDASSTFVEGGFRLRSSSAEMWLMFGSTLDHGRFDFGPAFPDPTSTRMWTNLAPQL